MIPQQLIAQGTRVAVHYNFENGRLSVRQILKTGTLRALLATVDQIVLEDCEFTVSRPRWRRWKDGAVNVRQFAEIRGTPVAAKADAGSDRWDEVVLNPHRSPDFRLAEGRGIVKRAAKVRIAGREMRALDPQ